MSVSIVNLGYHMLIAPERSLCMVNYFLVIVVVRGISINIVVLIILLEVVWAWVPITMVHHVLLLG